MNAIGPRSASYSELLDDGSVFVFGSNEAGVHGRGAAREARLNYGAEIGVGSGLRGRSFAIPTKDACLVSLPLGSIGKYVAEFLVVAAAQPEVRFQVTRVGCGLAGFTDDWIWPLFRGVSGNVMLPGTWDATAGRLALPRVVVAGSRSLSDAAFQRSLAAAMNRVRSKIGSFEVVSGQAAGPDRLGAAWARDAGLDVASFPARWDRWGKPAGFRRNRQMGWYATHLVAFHDGHSRGTANMIALARADGLKVWVPG